MRTLIGGVGYPDLRDHSAGLEVVARLSARDHGPDVHIEDVSYNPIAVVQWLEAEPPERRFDRVLFVSAIGRRRPPGTVTAYRWNGVLPPDAVVQQAVTEAVTGIIGLDNTVTIAGYFKALPGAVAIVEIEPLEHAFGSELSAAVEDAVERACALIESLASDAAAFDTLPLAPLMDRSLSQVDS